MELDKLCNESHIWVRDSTSLTNEFEALIQSHLLSIDHVAEAHGCWSWDSLDAVNINTTSFLFCAFHELYHFIEGALDVLTDMILQVERQVFHTFF